MRITIIPNRTKEKTEATLKELIELLDARKIGYDILELEDFDRVSAHAQKSDHLLYLGGDGTFIKTAKLAYRRDMALAGINTGTVGYLTNIDIANMAKWLDTYQKDDYDECPVLIYDDEVVINDIVVYATGSFAEFKVSYGALDFYTSKASGLILSTGFGSTGINLSNRGPVFPITSTDVAITPILPLRADGHAYVFPFDGELRISADRPFIVDVDGVRDKTERYAIDIKRAPKMIRRIR